jgi:catechol 2,3-dioxygenase-like lactoylglutathione lyase family enzyme
MSVGPIEHVLVLSDDIEVTRGFYCDVLGLRVGDRPPVGFTCATSIGRSRDAPTAWP